MTCRHIFFDGTLVSDFPIPLLAPAGPAASGRVVRVSWDPLPLPPARGPIISGGWQLYLQVRRTADGYRMELPWGAISLVINPAGDHVRVHPIADSAVPDPTTHVGPAGRGVPASLVSMGLGRLPALWGWVPVHAGAVATPNGVLCLAGPTGAGKSTLTQACADAYGWPLVDGDLVALRAANGQVRVIGMGGCQRLRGDAARVLGHAGSPMPGFANDKVQLLPRQQVAARTVDQAVEHSAGNSAVLGQFVVLGRRPAGAIAPQLTRSSGRELVSAVRPFVQGIDDSESGWQRTVLRTLAAVSGLPGWRLDLVREPATIPATTSLLAAIAAGRTAPEAFR